MPRKVVCLTQVVQNWMFLANWGSQKRMFALISGRKNSLQQTNLIDWKTLTKTRPVHLSQMDQQPHLKLTPK